MGRWVPLKVADFGLGAFTKNGPFKEIVGSAFYVAPEVLTGAHDQAADVWSCGVLMYMLLCGRAPFGPKAKSQVEVFHAVLKGNYNTIQEPWPAVSDSAKDLLGKMLTKNPKARLSSADCLSHTWISTRAGRKTKFNFGEAVATDLEKTLTRSKALGSLVNYFSTHLPSTDTLGYAKKFQTIKELPA